MSCLLVKNGIVATFNSNNDIFFDKYVGIKDGIIVFVDSKIPEDFQPEKTIDAMGKMLMPGFVNAHMHFYSAFARGIGGIEYSHSFLDVLKNLWWRLDAHLNLEDVYYSALTFILDGIRKGTTCYLDHHSSPHDVLGSLDVIARALQETGVRGSLCYEVSDRDGTAIKKEGIEENRRFIETCQWDSNPLITGSFGLHASFTLESETLEEVSSLCQELSCGIHIHAAESQLDQERSFEKYGLSVIERLGSFNLLNPYSICAHGVHLSEKEINLMVKNHTVLVHNPQSNMNNAVGIANVLDMIKKGVLVGLGTDAMTVNMIEEMRCGIWAQRHFHKNPSVAFGEMAQVLMKNNPHIAQRLFPGQTLGVIETGASADFILMDYVAPTPLSSENIYGHLAFGLVLSSVDTCVVHGNVLMECGKLCLDLDENEIRVKSREACQRLWKRMGC